MASPATFTHVPLCRTWTVRVPGLNQPPSPKCIPSWNTTRSKVCEAANVYPTQSCEAAFAPSQLSYCFDESPLPTAALNPSLMTLSGPPVPRGFITLAVGVPRLVSEPDPEPPPYSVWHVENE